MSVINVKRQHQISLAELKTKINQVVIQINKKLDFHSEWESDTLLMFRRKGASGQIKLSDHEFEISLKLGIAFKMMKNKIESEIVSIIDKYI
jgi:putative polyhydroxyalkanoate system protein